NTTIPHPGIFACVRDYIGILAHKQPFGVMYISQLITLMKNDVNLFT
ncbi:12498_t:CDS:1, partial [Racocetra persica]